MQRFSKRLTGAGATFASTTMSARCWIGLICALCVATGASADALNLNASQDQTANSSFTLDFGEYGGPRTANITTTQYQLEVDAVASSARFLSYDQHVESLELPGGIWTGNITVAIAESLAGPYDPQTGTFATNDTYLVYFEGDLSAYGLTSPVTLPGAASGTITYDRGVTGTIASAWSGEGRLPNPSDPGLFIRFAYNCVTNTVFLQTPEPATLTLLGLGTLVAGRRRP